MERLSEAQYWFVVAAVGLTPMLTFCIIDIVGWFLRRALLRHPEMAPPSGAQTSRDESTGIATPPG
jgi:hypothetical protein